MFWVVIMPLLLFSGFVYAEGRKETYIVHLDQHHMALSGHTDHRQWHTSVLAKITPDHKARLLYSYHSAISGFSASFTDAELAQLLTLDCILGAYPDRKHVLQTTYTYSFLGLNDAHSTLWNSTDSASDTIIAVIDTGVWPESPSFADTNMPAIPARWRGGTCNNFPCNRKLIGAKFFNSGHQTSEPTNQIPEYDSARDSRGHGTHTASTAAGAPVHGAGLLGNAHGTAQGMAPRARLAVYKVCWDGGCYSSDILAGIDAAIADGADVISLSIGGFSAPFSQDSVAIGAFRAAERGVFVACAAGNNGPFPASVSNEAPWVTTVGASTVDRKFLTAVRLDNGAVIPGEAVHPGGTHTPLLPLVYSGGRNGSRFCLADTLDPNRVHGKIVVCDRGGTARAEKGEVVRRAGGLAMVLADNELNGEDTAADAHVIPTAQIGYHESQKVKNYISDVTEPRASLTFSGTVYGLSPAPAVASFSSRGPSLTSPGILKPDILAPGVNILAAWPLNLSPSGLPSDPRRSEFNVVSGTSMACPHVAGVAALIKSRNAGFSPAAVRSALMTTAVRENTDGGPIIDAATGSPAGIFATGAGHLRPERAADPGLVYDMGPEGYIPYLCFLQYSNAEIQTITNRRVSCENVSRSGSADLNYPSIAANFNLSVSGQVTVTAKRTVTNVGVPRCVFRAHIRHPKGISIRVRPSVLVFKKLTQKKSFTVTVTNRLRKKEHVPAFSEGSLTWVSRRHRVRSPIAVTWSGLDTIQS